MGVACDIIRVWIISSPRNLHLAFRDPLALSVSSTKHVGSRAAAAARENPLWDFPEGPLMSRKCGAEIHSSRANQRWHSAQGHQGSSWPLKPQDLNMGA